MLMNNDQLINRSSIIGDATCKSRQVGGDGDNGKSWCTKVIGRRLGKSRHVGGDGDNGKS